MLYRLKGGLNGPRIYVYVSAESLSLAVFLCCLSFVVHFCSLRFLASDSLVRFLSRVLFFSFLFINVFLQCQSESRLENALY